MTDKIKFLYDKSFSGAAIMEGSLKPGDRLLEINGTSVDNMSQSGNAVVSSLIQTGFIFKQNEVDKFFFVLQTWCHFSGIVRLTQ